MHKQVQLDINTVVEIEISKEVDIHKKVQVDINKVEEIEINKQVAIKMLFKTQRQMLEIEMLKESQYQIY